MKEIDYYKDKSQDLEYVLKEKERIIERKEAKSKLEQEKMSLEIEKAEEDKDIA